MIPLGALYRLNCILMLWHKQVEKKNSTNGINNGTNGVWFRI